MRIDSIQVTEWGNSIYVTLEGVGKVTLSEKLSEQEQEEIYAIAYRAAARTITPDRVQESLSNNLLPNEGSTYVEFTPIANS